MLGVFVFLLLIAIIVMKISGKDLATLSLYLGVCGNILFSSKKDSLLSKLPSPLFVF